MIIQASHMNFNFMQKLKAQQEQGGDLGSNAQFMQQSATAQLGSGMNIDERAGFTPPMVPQDLLPAQSTEKSQQRNDQQQGPQTIGAAVANEVIRRLEESTNNEGGEGDQPKDHQDLRHSLGQTLDWINQRFGKEAATAAAGMVMSSTSSGVTEESIGDGLLQSVQLIDRNFGIAAGDATMANFNSNVNVALNNYFENGKTETFHAATTPIEGASANKDISARFFARAVQDASKETVDPNQKLLEELQKELDEVAELQNLTNQLEAKFNPTKAMATPQAAINAYTEQSIPTEPLFADIAV